MWIKVRISRPLPMVGLLDRASRSGGSREFWAVATICQSKLHETHRWPYVENCRIGRRHRPLHGIGMKAITLRRYYWTNCTYGDIMLDCFSASLLPCKWRFAFRLQMEILRYRRPIELTRSSNVQIKCGSSAKSAPFATELNQKWCSLWCVIINAVVQFTKHDAFDFKERWGIIENVLFWR